MSIPKLFYAPPGFPVRPITGRKVITVEGREIHNPKVDHDNHILPLSHEVPPPDSRLYDFVPVFTVAPGRRHVNMSWNTRRKSIDVLYRNKVEALLVLSRENALVLGEDFDGVSIDVAIIHLSDAAAGGTGPYSIPKSDGTWVVRTRAQLAAAVQALSQRINSSAANAQSHATAIAALRDAENYEGLADHDLSTGWS